MAKILVIDDEKGLCEEFKDILEEHDHEVELALSGSDGLKKIESNTFDVVFLDILMPRMDGTEVLKKIQEVSKLPVVIMSGFIPPGKGQQILDSGAKAVLRKPLDLDQVISLVDEIVTASSK